MCRFLYGHKFSVHLSKYQRVQLVNHMVRVCLILEETVFWSACTILHFHQQWVSSSCSTSLSAFDVVSVVDFSLSNKHVMLLVLICNSLIYDDEPLICLFVIFIYSFVKCLSPYFCISSYYDLESRKFPNTIHVSQV